MLFTCAQTFWKRTKNTSTCVSLSKQHIGGLIAEILEHLAKKISLQITSKQQQYTG